MHGCNLQEAREPCQARGEGGRHPKPQATARESRRLGRGRRGRRAGGGWCGGAQESQGRHGRPQVAHIHRLVAACVRLCRALPRGRYGRACEPHAECRRRPGLGRRERRLDVCAARAARFSPAGLPQLALRVQPRVRDRGAFAHTPVGPHPFRHRALPAAGTRP